MMSCDIIKLMVSPLHHYDIIKLMTCFSTGSAPKPQRPARGGGRQRNTVNNDIANTVSTENASAPDTAEQ